MLIRPATREDIRTMRNIYAPYVRETSISFEYNVPSLEEFALRFAEITAQYPWLVAEEGGCVCGYAYASQAFDREAYAWCVDLSVYVSQSARRRGIGSALYEALEIQLEKMGICNLLALITAENAASIAFHLHHGYEQVGLLPNLGYKFGQWHSLVWMQKRLRGLEAPGPALMRQIRREHE